MPVAGYPILGGPDPTLGTFGGEFFLDSDDNSPDVELFPYRTGNIDPKALHPVADGQQDIASLGVIGYSPPSHRGSSSSGSSRSAGSNSPKTSQTPGDMMMSEYAPMEGLKGFEGLGYDEAGYNDGVDADSIDMFLNMDSIDGAGNSPRPPTADGQVSLSPESLLTTPIMPSAKKARGHSKAQSQQSVTHSMNGLRRNGSREATPSMFASQESSPSGAFTSPSPEGNVGGGNFTFGNTWPSGLAYPVSLKPEHSNMPVSIHGIPPSVPPNIRFNNGQPFLKIDQTPLKTPLKSRVETQIPIKMTMCNMPPGIKRLHLPMHTISKAKLLAKPPAQPSPDMLELHTMLVCTSAMENEEKCRKAYRRAALARLPPTPAADAGADEDKPQDGGEVRICQNCINRERKRAARKKNKKPEEDELWDKYEHYRAIVFNTQEIKEWHPVADPLSAVPPGTVQVDAPMRIACYCRHHSEKSGFKVIFTIKDCQGNVVVQAMSNSIMITDDHKTPHVPSGSATQASSTDIAMAPSVPEPNTDSNSLEAPLHFRRHTQSTSDLQSLQHSVTHPFQQPSAASSQVTSASSTPRNLSRQTSPTSPSGPVCKKRKASGSAKVPTELAMTRMEPAQPSAGLPMNSQPESTAVSTATSPFTPNLSYPLNNDGLYSQGHQTPFAMQQPFPTGPPTPNSNNNDQILFTAPNRNMSVDNLAMLSQQSLYSAPVSAHPSRAPSPNHLRNDLNVLPPNRMAQNMYSMPIDMSTTGAPRPIIHKIIPAEGPKAGGIEVTVLGKGFTNGGLEVMFGTQRATTTTYWGESSLVCLLPPSPTTGPVVVSIKQPRMADPTPIVGKHQPIFRYIDDDEEQLMRTALYYMGQKMGSGIEDVAHIARAILNQGTGPQGWGSMPGSGGQTSGGYNMGNAPAHSLETGLLRVLELVDLDDSVNKARINVRRSTGQTMLHLGCSLGMIRFVAGLLSRGARCDVRDKGGFTPLHFAAMNNHPEIVRRLMISGADPTIRSLSGLTAADVAQFRDVLRVLRRVERQARRSRSSGSLHSRVSSATFLRSLWDSPSMTPSQAFMSDASDSATPSEDDSSGDGAQVDDDDEWLDMRRPSLSLTHTPPNITSPQAASVPAGMASPSTAMAAVRDQFAAQIQQLQQSWAVHLQNWPEFQMPQMPQLPGMPVLPDYQNYLHNAPVMQRIASLVPNIARPGSADGDKQWWEKSFFGARETPPPAYEDVFPQKDKKLDTKQATAAVAAAEYEADAKCEALYDQGTSESSKVRQVPALLQIGRKNAITKEQQENLQRAHAEKLKTTSKDKMLWFVWIPLLTLMLGAMMYSGAPAFVSNTSKLRKSLATMSRPLAQPPNGQNVEVAR